MMMAHDSSPALILQKAIRKGRRPGLFGPIGTVLTLSLPSPVAEPVGYQTAPSKPHWRKEGVAWFVLAW